MAEKDSKPKAATKSSSTAKSTSTAKTAATKPTVTVKPASEAKTTAAKPAATTAAKAPATTAKTSGIAGSAATKQTTAAKPAATTAAKAPATTAKTSGIAGSAATKQTTAAKPAATTTAKAPATAAKPSGIAGSAAEKPAASTAAAKPSSTPKSSEKAQTAAITKSDNSTKQAKAKPVKSSSSGKGQAVAAIKNKKLIYIISAAVAFVLILAILIGIIAGTKSCNNTKLPPSLIDPDDPDDDGSTKILNSTTVSTDRPVYNDTVLLNPVTNVDSSYGDVYELDYTAMSMVGYTATILDYDVERVKPVEEVRDERDLFPLGDDVEAAIQAAGTVRYPRYGSTMSSVLGSTAARDALINESDYLCAYGTYNNSGNGNNVYETFNATYNMMDAEGKLWFVNNGTTTPAENPDGTQRQLYKHSAAYGMYLEDFGGIPLISDKQPAVKKQITVRTRGYSSYSITGLYAPAGEVIKVEMSGADMNASGGITIHIGQALYNGQSNNIWTAKGQMQRFPNILNTMVVNKNTATYDEDRDVWTAYVGSFIGGPIYIRNTNVTVTATITGGLEYVHYVLGYTTEEEFERIKEYTTVPYFDLEVWQYGVLHSGPLYYATSFTYDDLYKAAILWEKVSTVTTTNGTKQGIVFLYDPFVAAGAAVAFPGRSSVNCPMSWMPSSLNYNSIVTSGSWGNFHEYHHNFQNFGIGYTGEVTNNALNLVSYSLFTKISSYRGIASYGAAGLSGWNTYTSATWALQRVIDDQISSTNGLAVYATLMHNFGQDAFISARGYSGVNYFNRWADITHQNMAYYATMSTTYAGVDYSAQLTANDYNMFVPVSCVYQTGRGYMYDGEMKYFKTMQPYVIPADGEFLVDLSKYNAPSGQYASGSIVIPDGFTYRVKSITQPQHGSIELVDNFNFKYIPEAGAKTGDTSGQIIVTLQIVKNDGAFKVDNVDLVLEFELSHETNKTTLERTTYTYTSDNMFTDAVEAYEASFGNYETVNTIDHSNPVQNANTDIWYYPDTEANREKYSDVPEHYFIHENMIDVIDGKLYFSESGKYRVYLRGRLNAAVYFSLDGKAYELGATIKDITAPANSAAFRLTDENTYFDIEIEDDGDVTITTYTGGQQTYNYVMTGDRWLYVKEILIMQSSPSVSYIGLGLGTWAEPLFTTAEKHYDAAGNEVSSTEDENYDHSETLYFDSTGKQVTIEEVNAAEMIAPKSATYANAYRYDYEIPDNASFESDYFYKREVNYNYIGEEDVLTARIPQTYMSEISNYRPWGDDNELLNIQNLFDGDPSTNIHTYNTFYLNDENPAILAFDMGEVVTANSLTLGVYTGNNLGSRAFPKALLLEGSLDGEKWFEMGSWSSLTSSYSGVALTFTTQQFRYYKISVTRSNYDITPRLALSSLELSYTMRLTGNGANNISCTNEHIVYTGDWETSHMLSVYGSVLVGDEGCRALLEFNGTHLAILTPTAVEDSSFDVYIDGVKMPNISTAAKSGDYYICYLSEKLEDKTHKVEIRCTGKTYIDSFAIFNEG